MNNYIIALFLLAAVATGFPTSSDQYVKLISMIDRRDDAGQYAYKYELDNGQVISEQGELQRTSDGRDNVLVKKGSYRYLTPEGLEVKTTYTAGKNGFRLVSDSVSKSVEPYIA